MRAIHDRRKVEAMRLEVLKRFPFAETRWSRMGLTRVLGQYELTYFVIRELLAGGLLAEAEGEMTSPRLYRPDAPPEAEAPGLTVPMETWLQALNGYCDVLEELARQQTMGKFLDEIASLETAMQAHAELVHQRAMATFLDEIASLETAMQSCERTVA